MMTVTVIKIFDRENEESTAIVTANDICYLILCLSPSYLFVQMSGIIYFYFYILFYFILFYFGLSPLCSTLCFIGLWSGCLKRNRYTPRA
ncbi:hypothetical protein J3Q64DRAFT_1748989, partial [Phycomyces blakesleeanus]